MTDYRYQQSKADKRRHRGSDVDPAESTQFPASTKSTLGPYRVSLSLRHTSKSGPRGSVKTHLVWAMQCASAQEAADHVEDRVDEANECTLV